VKPLWRVVLAVAILAAISLLLTRKSSPPEPQFEGKSFSVWLSWLFVEPARINPEAVRAFQAMGEPAVQRLMTLVEQEDSLLAKQILKHACKYPALGKVADSSFWTQYLAARALGEIGTNAASAIPVLTRKTQSAEKQVAAAAQAALIRIRNEPIEPHLSAFFDVTNKTYPHPFLVLCELGTHAESAIPKLLEGLDSPNKRVRGLSLHLLGYVGINSTECFAALTNLLQDSDSMVRGSAIDALANFGPPAKPAAPLVVKLLDDPDDLCQSSALYFLDAVLTPQEFAPYRARVEVVTNAVNEVTADLARILLRDKALGVKTN
jgi:HEAT repeat protein